MSSARVYESSNGDTWDVVGAGATGDLRVRHTPNRSSGGQALDVPLEDFLRIAPHSPEHQAVVAHIGSAVGTESTNVRGYIHDPKEPDGPYIAVVLRPDQQPVVTLHMSYAEAERELADKVAALKQKTLSHELRDGSHEGTTV